MKQIIYLSCLTVFIFCSCNSSIEEKNDLETENIKQPPPKEVDLVKNEGIAFRAPIEMMCT